MTKDELKSRTKALALRVMKMVEHLPSTVQGRTIGAQIMRSATSVAANYRAACRARSHPEFIAKLGIVLEEIDETMLWLELIIEGGLLPATRVQPLLKESDELTAIIFSAQRSARKRANAKS
jgi:four helix bundle protein